MVPALQTRHGMSLDQELQTLIDLEAMNVTWGKWAPSESRTHSLGPDAVKVLHSICQQSWKTQQWPQDWKRSLFIPIPKKGNAKEGSNYCTIALISHASKVMLKILQGFSSM